MKKHLFLALLLFQSLPAITVAEHLSACFRMDTLCTSLYGPQHPLRNHIALHRRLIAHYARQQKEHRHTRSAHNAELEVTLGALKEYIEKLLNMYQVPPVPAQSAPGQTAGTTSAATAAVPLPTPENQQAAAVAVSPAPNVTPAQTDMALNDYLETIQNNLTSFAQDVYKESQKKSFRSQKKLLFTGLAGILLLTLIMRVFVTDHSRKLRRIANGYQSEVKNNLAKTEKALAQLKTGGPL